MPRPMPEAAPVTISDLALEREQLAARSFALAFIPVFTLQTIHHRGHVDQVNSVVLCVRCGEQSFFDRIQRLPGCL